MPSNMRPPRRLAFRDDVDFNSDDSDHEPVPQTSSISAEKNANMAQIMMNDISTNIRNKSTSNDPGKNVDVNVSALLKDRDCNKKGTQAAKLASDNKQQLAGWTNYVNTEDAKSANVEQLENIADGQTHRNKVKQLLQQDAALHGGKLTLEQTYDEYNRGRGAGRNGNRAVPLPVGNHSTNPFGSNVRGGLAVFRGGGSAGRNGGRVIFGTKNQPLDPALEGNHLVDDMVGRIKNIVGKGSRSVRFDLPPQAKPNPELLLKRSEGISDENTGRRIAPPPHRPVAPLPSRPVAPLPSRPSRARPQNFPALSKPEDFMAAVCKKFKMEAEEQIAAHDQSATDLTSNPARPEPEGEIQADQNVESEQPSLISSQNKTVSLVGPDSNSTTEDNVTQAEPRVEQELLIAIDGMESGVLREDLTGSISHGSKPSVASLNTAVPDLMDMDTSNLQTEALRTTPAEPTVTVSKADADLLKFVKGLISKTGSDKDAITAFKSVYDTPKFQVVGNEGYKVGQFAMGDLFGTINESRKALDPSARTALDESKWAPKKPVLAHVEPEKPHISDDEQLVVQHPTARTKQEIALDPTLTQDQKISAMARLTQAAPVTVPTQSKPTTAKAKKRWTTSKWGSEPDEDVSKSAAVGPSSSSLMTSKYGFADTVQSNRSFSGLGASRSVNESALGSLDPNSGFGGRNHGIDSGLGKSSSTPDRVVGPSSRDWFRSPEARGGSDKQATGSPGRWNKVKKSDDQKAFDDGGVEDDIE